MDRLDVGARALPRVCLETEEQAIRWVEERVIEMIRARQACDVSIPGDQAATVIAQKRALWVFLTKQGRVTGALEALLLTGRISEICYVEQLQRALNTLVPSVVGRV